MNKSGTDIRTFVGCVVASVSLSVVAGCATLSGPYPERIAPAEQQFVAGNAAAAVSMTLDVDPLCAMFERGSMLHSAGEYKASNDALFAAENRIDGFDNRAVISARDTAATVGTLAINEKAAPYKGEGFERVMMQTYLALNHLMMGDIEGARVEVRKTFERQQFEADRHERAIEKSKKQAEDESFDVANALDSMKDSMAATNAVADRIKNAYQNAFAYYMSSVVYELNGEINDAYIDCKHAIELRPNAECVRTDLVRFAERLNFRDELATWKRKFGDVTVPKKGSGSVLVVVEYGMAPVKREFKIPIPTKYGLVFTALPMYEYAPSGTREAGISLDGERRGHTGVLADIEAMAARNLRDQMPILLVKQAVRAVGKGVVMKQMQNSMSEPAAIILGSLGSLVTEQADLRGWITLPHDIQVARVWTDPGNHRLTLDVTGQPSRQIDVSVEQNRITAVIARATGRHMYISVSGPLE